MMRNTLGLLFFCIIFVALNQTPAQAAISIKILRLEKSQIVVTQTSKGELTANQTLIAENNSGEKCDLTVTKVAGMLGLADTSACSFATDLQVGQKLISKDQDGGGYGDGKKKKRDRKKHGGLSHKIGGQLYYSMANQFQNAVTVPVLGQVAVTNDTSGAAGVGARYQLLFPQGFGAFAAISYEMTRSITKTSNSLGVTQTVGDYKYNLIWWEINPIYYYKQFFGFVGINYSLPTLAGTDTQGYGIAGDLGFNAGAGYQITDMFGAEIVYRTINQRLAENNIAYGQINYDYSRLWGIMIRVTAMFDILK